MSGGQELIDQRVDAWRRALEVTACGPVSDVWTSLSNVIDEMRAYLNVRGVCPDGWDVAPAASCLPSLDEACGHCHRCNDETPPPGR